MSDKSDNVVSSFSSTQARKIVGITYRQLDHWDRTDLVKPSVDSGKGSGSRRRYSYGDVLQLKIIQDLLEKGVDLRQVRQVIANLRDILGEELPGVRLVISGNEVHHISDDGEVLALLHQPGQQTFALIVLEMADIKENLDGAIVRELPEASSQQPALESALPQADQADMEAPTGREAVAGG